MSVILFWIVFNVPLGPLAPYVLGIALGRKPNAVLGGENASS